MFSQLYLHNVIEMSAVGQLVRTFSGGGLSSPTGIAIDPAGNLAVGSWGTATVAFYDPVGHYLGAIGLSGGERPMCLAYDRDGNLFVGGDANRVQVFNPQLQFIRFFGAGTFAAPVRDIALDKSQNLWITAGSAIWKFSRNGELLGSIIHPDLGPAPGTSLGPNGIAIDEEENLYIANGNTKEIFVFAPDGQFL
jgi:sugar lactone lactonase YvrE